MLLGGVPGVAKGNVLILGGGIVGTEAAKMAAGLGANVTLLDVDLNRLRYLANVMPANVTMRFSSPSAIEELLPLSDLVIGAVLIPGARAPLLVTRHHLKTMKPGSVLVDVAVDQGGCIEVMNDASMYLLTRCRLGDCCLTARRNCTDLRGNYTRRADVCCRWRVALLCRQHARSCAIHFNNGSRQCNIPIRLAAS